MCGETGICKRCTSVMSYEYFTKGVTLNMNTNTLNEVIAYDYTDGELLHNPNIAQTAL